MPISNADFSGNTFVLDPMELTMKQVTLITNIINNIQANKGLVEGVSQDSETKLNEVIAEVNALQDGTSVNIAELEQKINAILFLESEAGNDSFVGAFTKLYEAVNGRKETDAFTMEVNSSPAGVFALDLTPFGFTTQDEYEVFVQPVTTANGQALEATFAKDSVTSGNITLRDKDRLSFAANDESFYEAQVKGAVKVTVIVVKTATPITASITEVDGDARQFGA